MKKSQHILIIRLSAMGDVAMTIPVVYAFAKAYPDTKITFLSKVFFKPIIETIPNVHFVAAETNGKHKGIAGLWRLSRELKQLDITHVGDMHNVLRSKILRTFLRLPSSKINKGRSEKKALTAEKNKIFQPLKTTIERYVEVLTDLGFDQITPQIVPKKSVDERVSDLLGTKTQKWVGIAPFAAHAGKQYPVDLMKQVIATLDALENVRVILLGGVGEHEFLQELIEDTTNCVVVAEKMLFSQEINLISNLDVMLSMDSGNGHLAAMFGVPTVTLWGVTHPYAGFAPFNQDKRCILSDRVKYPLIPTSIYGNKVPVGYEDVMQTITPEQVVNEIMTSLEKN